MSPVTLIILTCILEFMSLVTLITRALRLKILR